MRELRSCARQISFYRTCGLALIAINVECSVACPQLISPRAKFSYWYSAFHRERATSCSSLLSLQSPFSKRVLALTLINKGLLTENKMLY